MTELLHSSEIVVFFRQGLEVCFPKSASNCLPQDFNVVSPFSRPDFPAIQTAASEAAFVPATTKSHGQCSYRESFN